MRLKMQIRRNYSQEVRFVADVQKILSELQYIESDNCLFQDSRVYTYCSPFLFLAANIDLGYINKYNPPFESFCDWGAGRGTVLLFTKKMFPRIKYWGVEKDINLIENSHPFCKPEHADCLTFTRVADINYTFNISWDGEFKKNLFGHIIDLMCPGQLLIEAYDYNERLLHFANKLKTCEVLTKEVVLSPLFTIVRKL